MPVTRIPIDGLWRALCPSIDTFILSHTPRTSTKRGRITCSFNSRKHFHSLPRICSQDTNRSNSKAIAATSPFSYFQQPPHLSSETISNVSPSFRRSHPAASLPIRDIVSMHKEANLDPRGIHDWLREAKARKDGYKEVVDIVRFLIEDLKEEPALIHYDALIRANADAENGSLEVVKGLLEEMRENGIQGDSGFYHGLLEVLAIHPDYVLRTQILDEMKEKWIGLSPDGWHSLVVGLLRDRQYEIAMDKLEQMQADEIRIRPWLYDILTFQLCEADELDEVCRLLKYRAKYESTSSISLAVWFYVLDAFADAMHYEGLKFVWTMRVSSSMVNPTDGICVAALNTAARNSDPGLATSAMRILSARRSTLAPFHYEALLTAYTNSHDLKTAFRILAIMTKSGLVPDARNTRALYTYLTHPEAPSYIETWSILKDLNEDGHILPVAAANVILESAVQTGHFEDAVHMYKELYTFIPSGPDVETFNTLLQGAKTAGKESAMFLASEMRALGIKPNHITYDRLILSCLREEDYEDAFRYLGEMVEVGERQGEEGGWWMRRGTATLMVKICLEKQDERAWALLEEMKRRNMGGARDLEALGRDKWEGEDRKKDKKRGILSGWAEAL